MNSIKNPIRQFFLLGLFGALAASGLLAIRQNPVMDTPTPAQERIPTARCSAGPQNSSQTVKRVSHVNTARRGTESIPGAAHTTYHDAGECGYEIPSPYAMRVPASIPTTETDPAKLCAALAAALAGGKAGDIAALHSKLLDLGSIAVPSVRALLNTGRPEIDVEAVRLLVQIGDAKALAGALGKMLTLPASSPAYYRCLAAFADCRSAAVAAWLVDFLGQTQSEEIRQRVLTILSSLRGPEVIQSLAVQFRKPADQMHADDCAATLATASNPAQAVPLKKLLETGETSEIQILAAFGLASVGNAEACATLVETGSSAKTIATACHDALATVSSAYGQETLIQAAVSSVVPSAVRCAAVRALANQHGQRVQTVLANLGQATTDPALQTQIFMALQFAGQIAAPSQSMNAAGDAGINGESWF